MPKYQNYRVCYENGNPVTGKEIYELYKYCDCEDCKNRTRFNKKEIANKITITTKDILKVDEVTEFLKNWKCKNGKIQLKIAYMNM